LKFDTEVKMAETASSSQRKYLYTEIVQQIEEMIQIGELKVGDKLPPERTLAATFKVSRNCIRQAIQALSEKKILESRRGDGTYIGTSDQSVLIDCFAVAIQAQKDLLRDIMEFRLLIEPQIASLAAKHIVRDELDRLKVIVCDQQRRFLAGEPDSDLDAEFHLQLSRASRNRVIERVFDTMSGILNESRSEFLQSEERRKASVIAHLTIIDALEKRDSDMALEAMKDHLLAVEQIVFAPV
jgi:GntR family transcriptional regulator, transcriptional repressor for pyruvate dehydrogenase complex